MATMGRYCKAYPTERFEEFAGWRAAASRRDAAAGAAHAASPPPEWLFLHENYVVTEHIFVDDGIVFDAISPEWVEFCHSTLGFERPQPSDAHS